MKKIFKKFSIENANDDHESLFRICGIMFMTMSFNSFAMPNYSNSKYKLRFILSRLAVSIFSNLKNVF